MLNNLFGGSGAEVYITVSPSCGLELMEVDKSGNIKSYAHTALTYNEAQREIADYNEFKTALETLFQMRNINPAKAHIHLSIPTVWFGLKEGIPLLVDDTAIDNIVLGELEQTYIFKRKDPMPVWFEATASTNTDSRSVFYSAVQKESIEQIKEIDYAEVKDNLLQKVEDLKQELKDLDKEKAIEIARIKANQIRKKAEELIHVAKEKGTPMVQKAAQEVKEKTTIVLKEVLNHLEGNESTEVISKPKKALGKNK